MLHSSDLTSTPFIASRAAALARLNAFVPSAGRQYAARRNYDYGPANRSNISVLSPYVRHRMLTEQDIVEAVLQAHTPSAAEKFIQEVCWRTYWKGWLERRPQVWVDYLARVAALRDELADNGGLRRRYDRAIAGATGVDAFDAFAHELNETGYLHNHARMWFASMWIYTLGLPWQLGADYFFRTLIDGDPASNTLSWRWVCGLQTVGKTYLARPDNIETYTGGRFRPQGLASDAPPLPFDGHPPAMSAPPRLSPLSARPVALMISEDDLNPESLPLGGAQIAAIIALDPAPVYAGHATHVIAFKQAAVEEALARANAHFNCPGALLAVDDPAGIVAFLQANKLDAAAIAYCPVGYMQTAMPALALALKTAGVELETIRRAWDDAFWPHAARGFFQLKEKIAPTLDKLLTQPTLF